MPDAAKDPAPLPRWKIALSDLDFGPEERQAVVRVLDSKWISMGAETQAFEEEFAAEIGVKHAIAVSSGTAALHLAYLALGLGPGDEIAQPAVNFVAAANCTILVGARPLFCDIRSLADPTLDPQDLLRRAGPRTKAAVAMHYGGAPCRMEEIVAACRARGMAVIEDACHGVGGTCGGRKMGALGDVAAFSFFPNKNLAVGEGGMVATDRDDLAEKVRLLRSHGMTSLTWDRYRGHSASYDVVANGLNYRLDEIRSAIGRAQLKKLGRNNERRRRLAREYRRLLRGEFSALLERGWIVPELGVNGEEAAHHLMVVLAPTPAARDSAAQRAKSHGIQTSLHYPFIPDFTAFRERGNQENRATHAGNLETARQFCARVLTLPLHPLMRPEDVRQVVESLGDADG